MRRGSTPEVMAAMRNTVIGLLRVIGETNIVTLSRRESSWWIDELAAAYPGPVAPAVAAGKRVLLSIRPEKIMQAAEAGDGRQVRFAATIAEVIFAGDIHRYTAACADGDSRTPARCRSSVDENCTATTAPSAAIPSSPATRATALLTPEAIPAWRSSTPASTAAVTGRDLAAELTALEVGARRRHLHHPETLDEIGVVSEVDAGDVKIL